MARRSTKAAANVVAAKRVRKRAKAQADKLVEIAGELAAPARATAKRVRNRADSLSDIARELAAPAPTDSKRARKRADSLIDIARELAAPARSASKRVGKRATNLVDIARELADSSVHRARSSSHEAASSFDTDAPLDIVAPARPISMQLIAGRGHYERVLQAVLGAKVSVWIATANVKELMVEDRRAKPGKRRSLKKSDYVSVLSQLDELAARGVELRLLHAEIPSGPFRREIAQHPRLLNDLALRRCPRVHLKAVIVDGELLYLGSANWTGAGLGAKGSGRRNFELGFVTDDAQLLDQIQAMYERIWSGGECGTCKLRDECPGPLADL